MPLLPPGAGENGKPLYSLLKSVVYAFIFCVIISITVCFCFIASSLLLFPVFSLSDQKDLSDLKPQPKKKYMRIYRSHLSEERGALKETRDSIRTEYAKKKGVYSLKCLITNKCYVGSALVYHTLKDIDLILFYNARKKYGLENFVFNI
jgi:hypothetical protein